VEALNCQQYLVRERYSYLEKMRRMRERRPVSGFSGVLVNITPKYRGKTALVGKLGTRTAFHLVQ
jgi:hypothetical protein